MHQLPRPSPRSTTPATNPTTNPERTNNSRDPPPSRTRSSVDLASYTERAGGDAVAMASRAESAISGSQDRENTKLNQIIQHFHTKAALTICSSRANLPQVQTKAGETRQNRWFNLILDETDVLLDDLQEWKRPNLYAERPPPMVIEIYIDSAQLAQNESLVLVDDDGKRTEVAEALATSADSSPRPTKNGGKHCEVVLERWTIDLGSSEGYTSEDLKDPLPNVYKKGVALFRSLYTFLRCMPAWKLHKRLGRHANHGLKLKFRIRQALGPAGRQKDTLSMPLCPSELQNPGGIVQPFELQPLVTPAGPLRIVASFRGNCEFSVADQESLLSSTFLGMEDEGYPTYRAGGIGQSLPSNRSGMSSQGDRSVAPASMAARERPGALLGAYGSLGTFHGPDPKRNSPVSELRQLALESGYDDDMDRVNEIRAGEGVGVRRRSYQPAFKGGSLASSPRPSPSPGTSAGRTESALSRYAAASAAASSSKRASLNALPQQQLRTPPLPNETAVASSGSTSPRPAPVKYSSSFAGRTRRFPSQSSKAAESNTSSGRGSSDSREKPDQAAEGTAGDSSGTRTDEDDIASFISDLEKSSSIKFHTSPSNRDNVINLSKYSQLRDPNAQLADEMSSSSLIQASAGTPESRRLSNVPGLSMSNSPNRALTHAPHVRSRLSTSIVEEGAVGSRASGTSGVSGEGSDSPKIPEAEEDVSDEEPFIFPHDNNNDNID